MGAGESKFIAQWAWSWDELRRGKRKYQRGDHAVWVGEVDGVAIIDDYGHHPVEISAVLAAARTSARRNVIAVVQPHRYTRLRDLFTV